MYIKSGLILSGVALTSYTTFFASTSYWVSLVFATTATYMHVCPSSSAAITLCSHVTLC